MYNKLRDQFTKQLHHFSFTVIVILFSRNKLSFLSCIIIKNCTKTMQTINKWGQFMKLLFCIEPTECFVWVCVSVHFHFKWNSDSWFSSYSFFLLFCKPWSSWVFSPFSLLQDPFSLFSNSRFFSPILFDLTSSIRLYFFFFVFSVTWYALLLLIYMRPHLPSGSPPISTYVSALHS